MTKIASILHVSDLHFNKELTEKGRRHWLQGVNSHSFGKLDAFSCKISSLRILGKKADILLATGDICTDGLKESLETARLFIENDDIYRGNPSRLIIKGLGAKANQRLIIPGNHDRYIDSVLPYQGASNLLETVFETPNKYPYVIGYRRTNKNDINEPALLFFVFDSTASETLLESNTPWVRIARGRIENQECRKLAEQPFEIGKTGQVMSFDGTMIPINYENAVKIVVLHHHPIDKKQRGWFDSWKFMENSQAFVEACFEARVNIVLFGHQHEDYREERTQLIRDGIRSFYHKINFFCCPSTTEFSEENNGFYYIDIYDNKFTFNSYIWNGNSFIDGEVRDYTFSSEFQTRAVY